MRVRTLALNVLAGVLLVAAALWLARPESAKELMPDTEALERGAAQRFQMERGLSPCDHYGSEILVRANAKLIASSYAGGDIIAVVLPTFSEMAIVTFGPAGITSYRVQGESLFAPPISDWFEARVYQLAHVELEPKQMYAIAATLSRSVAYAMTSPIYRQDQVGYYIGRVGDTCAFTTNAHEQGPAALISQMIAEAASDSPDPALIAEMAREVDRYDIAR